jgi:FtsP/CotA-like multicopper oxidase with cupredoxin domain
MARRVLVAAACAAALTAAPVPGAGAAVRRYWVAAVPVTWNVVPNGRDAIMGRSFPTTETVFPTVVYHRYSPGWRRPLRNAPQADQGADLLPGPLIRARVGDRVVVHFKNLDTLYRRPHSMHFHGVAYRPSSDGAYVPGFSGRDGNVRPGQTWTYRLRARPDSAGVWPYHDHSPSMEQSIEGGMYGALSILRRHERPPDREFVVYFNELHGFMTIDGRAFVGNTPVFRARVGDRVQWDVLTLGSDTHTFHVHGHRWLQGGVPRDTRTLGPAESFRVRWREDAPGTWLYHCHVEDHMMRGMIGIYRVSRR